jgi:hypothetical protein
VQAHPLGVRRLRLQATALSARGGRVRAVDPSPQSAGAGRSGPLPLAVVLGAVCALGAVATDLYLSGLPSVAADLDTSALSIQLTPLGAYPGRPLQTSRPISNPQFPGPSSRGCLMRA